MSLHEVVLSDLHCWHNLVENAEKYERDIWEIIRKNPRITNGMTVALYEYPESTGAFLGYARVTSNPEWDETKHRHYVDILSYNGHVYNMSIDQMTEIHFEKSDFRYNFCVLKGGKR